MRDETHRVRDAAALQTTAAGELAGARSADDGAGPGDRCVSRPSLALYWFPLQWSPPPSHLPLILGPYVSAQMADYGCSWGCKVVLSGLFEHDSEVLMRYN